MSGKLLIPIIATMFLMVSGYTILFILGPGINETDFGEGKTTLLDFTLVKCVSPISVENARWQILVVAVNQGTHDLSIKTVYLNDREVDVYGLIHGDTLPNGDMIGVSVPNEGLIVEPGDTLNVYIWVGSNLLSSGTQVTIRFNDPNSITLMKTIILT